MSGPVGLPGWLGVVVIVLFVLVAIGVGVGLWFGLPWAWDMFCEAVRDSGPFCRGAFE